MKTITTLFLILLGMIACSMKPKFKGKPCTALGFDCDSSKLCCGDYHCVNDRCQIDKEESTLEYDRRRGGRCDEFHGCNDGLRCESHRCTSKDKKVRQEIVQNAGNIIEKEIKQIFSE